MITFSRTLLVGGEFLNESTLRFHGILEDHIYAMELQVEVGIGDAIQRFISEKRISQPKYTMVIDKDVKIPAGLKSGQRVRVAAIDRTAGSGRP